MTQFEQNSDEFSSSQLSPDFVIDSRYKILSLLGRGAQAAVYLAEDILLSRKVALKVFDKAISPNMGLAFSRELHILGALNHPNIVHIYASGDLENGDQFLAMEFVEGRSLEALLRESGLISPSQFVMIFSQILPALQYLHEAGVIHRDLKPANILISLNSKKQNANAPKLKEIGSASEKQNKTGDSFSKAQILEAKLVDFGIAKSFSSDLSNGQTQTAAIAKGTAAYMSPEQCKSQPLDARSDIYSLSCVMYEALSGNRPFSGSSDLDLMYKQINETPAPLASVTAKLAAFVAKGLEKNPEDRYASAEEMLASLPEASELLLPERVLNLKSILSGLTLLSILVSFVFLFLEFRKNGLTNEMKSQHHDGSWHFHKGKVALLKDGNEKKAIYEFEETIKDNSSANRKSRIEALERLSQLYSRVDLYHALAAGEKRVSESEALSQSPENTHLKANAHLGLIDILGRLRKCDEALAQCDQAISAAETLAEGSGNRIYLKGTGLIAKANTNIRCNRLTHAETDLKELKLFEDKYQQVPAFNLLKFELANCRIQFYIMSGKLADAKENINVLSELPQNLENKIDCLTYLETALNSSFKRKYFDLALFAADRQEQILKSTPEIRRSLSSVYFAKSRIYLLKGDEKNALVWMRKVLSACENSNTAETATLLYGLSGEFEGLNNLSEAESILRRAKQIFDQSKDATAPTPCLVDIRLARVHFEQKKAAEAEKELRETIAFLKSKQYPKLEALNLAELWLARVLSSQAKVSEAQSLRIEVQKRRLADKEDCEKRGMSPEPYMLNDTQDLPSPDSLIH